MGGRRARNKVFEGKVLLKPLSTNQCWQGRRYKTGKYRAYEKMVKDSLPDNLQVPARGHLMIYIRFGHSNSAFDWDNGIKPFQDILQKKYGFNDRRVYFGVVEKVIVPKGEEYIYFKIKKLTLLEKLRQFIKDLFYD